MKKGLLQTNATVLFNLSLPLGGKVGFSALTELKRSDEGITILLYR